MKAHLEITTQYGDELESREEVDTDEQGNCWFDCDYCGARHVVKVTRREH